MAISPQATNLNSIRYRAASGVRALDHSLQAERLFAANEARFDRVKAKLSVPILFTSPLSESLIEEYVASLPNLDQNNPDILRITDFGSNRWKLRIAPDRWLFSGKGVLKRENDQLNADLDLEMNPTRFWAHQHEAPGGQSDIEKLALSENRKQQLRAMTLDGNDNFLFEPSLMGGTIFSNRQELWSNITEQYFETVLSVLREAFQPPNLAASCAPIWTTLLQAEVYWELETSPSSTTNAPIYVSELAKNVAAADGQAIHNIQHSQAGSNANAQWVRLKLSQSISLTIYAKALDRVRFEITYAKSPRQEAQRFGSPVSGTALHTLDALRQGAANRVQQFWSDYISLVEIDQHSGNLVEFMTKLNRSVAAENLEIIVTLLHTRGNLSRTDENGIAPTSVCRALVRAGVLELSTMRNRGSQYRLTARYRNMFDHLDQTGVSNEQEGLG